MEFQLLQQRFGVFLTCTRNVYDLFSKLGVHEGNMEVSKPSAFGVIDARKLPLATTQPASESTVLNSVMYTCSDRGSSQL